MTSQDENVTHCQLKKSFIYGNANLNILKIIGIKKGDCMEKSKKMSAFRVMGLFGAF